MVRKFFKLVVLLGIPALLSDASAQTLVMRTMAGTTTPGATNGFGSNARFNAPSGVAADSAGNIYVADTENSSIRKITPAGLVSTFAGVSGSSGSVDGTSTIARFIGPQSLAADNTGHVYVADSGNGTIRLLSASGTVSTAAGVAGSYNSFDGTGANAQFSHPEGVTVGFDGNIYIADTWNHTVRKMSPSGQVTTLAGLAGYAGATDGTNSKARFNRPAGVAADPTANLFIADSFNHTIREISPAGVVTTIAGLAGVWGSVDGTNNTARFYLPQSITYLPTGDLLVTDSGNQTLRKLSLSGTNWIVTTVAGQAGIAGATNGVGTTNSFDSPAGIASDGAGYIYVADMANNLIRTTRVVPPTIQSFPSGNQLVLSWPSSSEGFVLQQATNLQPTAVWSNINSGIAIVGDNFFRTNALSASGFYRLHLP